MMALTGELGTAANTLGYGDYADYIIALENQRKQSLAAIREEQAAREAAAQAQVDQLVAQIEALRPQYRQQFEDNARGAYVENRMAKRDLPQQLSAQGITGGLSESSALALDAAYGNAYNNYQRDYQNNLTALDNQVNQARMSGQQALGDIGAEYASMLNSARESYANSIAQAKLQAALDAREQAYNQQLLDWEKEQANREYALKLAKLSGTGSGGNGSGATPDTADAGTRQISPNVIRNRRTDYLAKQYDNTGRASISDNELRIDRMSRNTPKTYAK